MPTACKRRLILVGILAGIWLATSACSCGELIESAIGTPVPVAYRATELAAEQLTATKPSQPSPTPSATPRPTMLIPTKPPEPTLSAQLADKFVIPSEPDKEFVIEITEAELAELLASEMFEAQGVTIKDIRVTLTSNEMLLAFEAKHQETGLDVGLTVRGVPKIVDGAPYFEIRDMALDESVKGIKRLLLKAAIDKVIEQYTTSEGVPLPFDIPTDKVDIQDIQLTPGKITIRGRTR